MGLTKSERETIFRWAEDERVVSVWSASPVVWRKLERLGVTPYRTTKARDGGHETGRFYRMPLGEFRWGKKRVASAKSTEHMAKMRQQRATQ